MTALDLTPFQNMSQEQFISHAHSLTTVPSVLMLWIWTMFLLGLGGIFVNNKSKYYGIMALVFIGSGIVLVGIIYMPNVVYNFAEWIRNFFSF